ncbi:phosphoesterase [Haloprofundus marisrubri]|uniref:Phosphoesterase n=1 Tax=Haloprofundus marisrubri TaxID=1514971 RepID=A0A0W1RCN3_9EURY|nr:metallophosphoesterase [Haloprofundus marisrubri]KTG10371.1 phosphoesterase [Haloprofundus marisrubri]
MAPPAVEPVPGEPAATADLGDERALVVADYHAGIEVGLRYERGVELASNADARRERLLSLLDRIGAERVVVLGDIGHRIGNPKGDERDELVALFDALDSRDVPLTLVAGNHDGGVADAFEDRIDVTPGDGVRMGNVGFLHGHTWPSQEVLRAETVCMGHEHVTVKLQDSVGGGRVESAWLRGPLRREMFAEHLGVDDGTFEWADPELVVFPVFNERSGGTWVNVDGQEFLSPFLPEGLESGELYLLDGTRLGDYRTV